MLGSMFGIYSCFMCLPEVESVSVGFLGGGAKEDDERQLEPKWAEPSMDDILGTFCALIF